MVTSAAVPAVVGTAMVGTAWFFVGATPSRERTSALDPELVGEVLDTIKKAANEGYTMLLVSHEMNFVKNVATRVIFLENGKIIEDGPPKEVFTHPKSDRVREFFAKINRMVEPEYSI